MWKRMLVCLFIVMPVSAQAAESVKLPVYRGTISDAHGHVLSRLDLDMIIRKIDRNNVDMIVIMPKGSERGTTGNYRDSDILKLAQRYPSRVVPGIGFQNSGWRSESSSFLRKTKKKAESGKYQWMGETSLRGGLGEKVHVPPSSPVLREVLDISAKRGLPVTIHNNNPTSKEVEQFQQALDGSPKAVVIWTHWCGLASTSRARKFLEKYPNLYCDLTWLYKPRSKLPKHIVNGRGRFLPEWQQLIEDYPDRFLVGTDATQEKHYKKYRKRIRKIRKALGGLKPETARKVATENFHRILGR